MLPLDTTGLGAARTDTISRLETVGDRRIVMRRIIWSHLERDTMFNSQPAFVLSIRTTFRTGVTSGDPKGDFSTSLVLDGIETGVAIISRTGALLQRSRTGEARGGTTYTGRGAGVYVPQYYKYESLINAIGK
jgi:hypothetical protein